MSFIDSITQGLSVFFGFDSSVTIVGIILLVSLLVRVDPKKAILGAIKVSIGLTGIFMVVTLIQDAMVKPVLNIVTVYGIDKSVVDIGWGCLGYAFGNTYGYFGVLVFLILNVVLVSIRFTQTLYVDVFNTWRAMLLAGMIGVASGSFWIATLSLPSREIISRRTIDDRHPL